MPASVKLAAIAGCLAALLITPHQARAQTTQCVISGRVKDVISGARIPGATIEYSGRAEPVATPANNNGFYILPLLSPGTYRIRVSKSGYQSQEVNDLQLAVASALSLDFALRPASDIWDKTSKTYSPPDGKVILDYYATDVDHLESAGVLLVPGNTSALQSTISYVIDSQVLEDLPLDGRDVYTMLATIAGATSDAPTSRSLGLVINGQRPSSSNFLLDGVENNNYLITGPLALPPPEAIQEYRISTNNFSAEYGRTGGYLANAITASGQNDLHANLYYILENDALNGNDFQNNLNEQPRTPLKQWERGFFAGGAPIRNSLFVSFSLDDFRFRSRQQTQPFTLLLPTYLPPANTIAGQLLRQYPTPVEPGEMNCPDNECTVNLAPPASLDRLLLQPRVDYLLPGGKQRFMARLTLSRSSDPDFVWTPYQGFSTALDENVSSFAGAWSGQVPGGLLGEVRLGWSSDDLRFDRPHPEVPSLSVSGLSVSGLSLPGSPAFYGYRNRSIGQELVANATKPAGRHILKFGGGFLPRRIDGYLTADRDGVYFFNNLTTFFQDQPDEVLVSLSRLAYPQQLIQPDYNRNWSYTQFYLYAQDSYKVAKNLVLNFGLRYENYGAPRSTNASADAIIQPGSGATLADQLTGAKLSPYPNQLFEPDNNDWGVRTGISWSPDNSRTVLHGGYGIYFDRPFDNLWQNLRNNNNLFGEFTPPTGFNYLTGLQSLRSSGIVPQDDQNTAQFTLYNPNIRNARIYNYFAGVQRHLATNMFIEVNGVASAGRNLITTDMVNRMCSVKCLANLDNLYGRINPAFPDIHYRSSQGTSDYNALTAVFRYRIPAFYFQASYAWSHTIDIQSEPLAGDFFNILGQPASSIAAFTTQFTPNADRANSDFDQRHNLAFFSIWSLPAAFPGTRARALFRDWKFSQLAAVRSGLPFTVEVPQSNSFQYTELFNNPASLAQPSLIFSGQGTPVAGGVNWFNPAALAAPAAGAVGDSRRNEFRGPGFTISTFP